MRRMREWVAVLIAVIGVSVLGVSTAFGAETTATAKEAGGLLFVVSVLTGGFAMAVASAAAAIGQSRAIVAALDGIARQPSAAGRIQTAMIIGLALIESLAIYVLLIALILFFANPFTKYVVPGA